MNGHRCNKDQKEVLHHLHRDKNHVYNQAEDEVGREGRLWEILLDSQSTCNAIINPKLLTNIRNCDWTLRLQTQARECRINQVGDSRGVGTAWYYP